MTPEQECLLLTTARILRAHLRDALPAVANMQDHGDLVDDLDAMKEALAPFDPLPEPPRNDANDFAAMGIHMPGVTE